MGDRFTRVAYKVVNARYSVPAWILAFISTAFGALVLLFLLVGDPAVTDALDGFILGGYVWASVLTLAGLFAMVGMARYRPTWVRIGSMASFFGWLYGCGVFVLHDPVNIILIGLPMLIFWGYKYVASVIRDRDAL